MGCGHSNKNPATTRSIRLTRERQLGTHASIVQILWIRQHSSFLGKLSFNIIREICSYLGEGPRKLVLFRYNEVKYFDTDTKRFQRLWKIRSSLLTLNAEWTLLTDYKIFVCGGITPSGNDDSGHYVGQVCTLHIDREAYKLNEDGTVYHLTDMIQLRYHHAVLYHAGDVYVFGGLDKTENAYNLRSCEKYSVSTNQWQALPDMHESRCSFTPCWYLSVVYLCGGCRTSVETFDPVSNIFTLLPELTLPEGGWCVAVITSDGELVALTTNYLSKMQQWRFNTKRHTSYKRYPPLVQREIVYIAEYPYCYVISLDTGEQVRLT